jgi:hypothetical protein
VTEIAHALGVSRAHAARLAAAHRHRLPGDATYAACCAEVTREGLREVFGVLAGLAGETDGV